MSATMTTPREASAPPRSESPAWERPALLGLLALTALLYTWDLAASGWANAFYASAVQAGSESWTAFLFGSLDAGNAITVDKPPASLWVMALSARVFGMSSWSLLVPQALMGVATVGLVHTTVRRHFSAQAALLAGTVLALTPVAALMFRFNNPDALLVLLLTGATYAMVRAQESTRTRWLVLAAALVGTGFLTKTLQAYLVLPAFVAVYLLTADTPVRRRLLQLGAAGAALVVASGWWVAVVELWPASARPYIGGSQTDSALELALGYNGLGRITGNEAGAVTGGGGGGGGNQWGTPGLLRMFDSDFGGQVAWLLPAALLLAGALLWWSRRAPRTDPRRAQVLLWLGPLLVTALTFSLMQGIIHAYYAVALAPAIAALVGIGAAELWRLRTQWQARAVLGATMAATTLLAWVLLSRSPDWFPALRVAVVLVGLAAGAALLILPLLGRRLVVAVAATALVAGLAGPTAYAVQTASTVHTGSLPSAGPAVTTGDDTGVRGGGGGGDGGGGLLDASTPSDTLLEVLTQDADSFTWIGAAVGAQSAAGYQLGSGEPVLAIGGFNGTDPSPTLEQFQEWVAEGEVHWFVAGSGGGRTGGPGGDGSGSDGSGTSAQITAWVTSAFTSTTVDGVELYDLTS